MGGKSRKVEAPDYSGIIAASERAANQAYKLGKDQLAWAKEQYKSDRRILDRVVNSALERQAVNDKNAASDRARYEERFQPLENELIEDARSFSSAERHAQP